MKLVRALIAAAVTVGAVAAIQLTTASAASAQPDRTTCGACWNYNIDDTQ